MRKHLLASFIFNIIIINSALAENTQSAQQFKFKKTKHISAKNIESKRINLNNLSFHYLEKSHKDSAKPLMIFLHGFPYFASAWKPLLVPLSDQYHVVALDNRGYAYSTKPEDVNDYHIRHLVNDVKSLIDTLNNKRGSSQKTILVGHDWGGVVAWTVAQQYPELIAQVIVINAPPFNTFLRTLSTSPAQQEASKYVPWLSSWLSRLAFFVKGPELLWGKSLVSLHENGHVDDAFKAEFLAAWRQENAASSATKWYQANIPEFDDISAQHYWPEAAKKITVPSLLIWSKDDKAFTQDMFEAIIADVEQVKVNVIDTSSHAPFLDHTDQVLKYIREFLLENK